MFRCFVMDYKKVRIGQPKGSFPLRTKLSTTALAAVGGSHLSVDRHSVSALECEEKEMSSLDQVINSVRAGGWEEHSNYNINTNATYHSERDG